MSNYNLPYEQYGGHWLRFSLYHTGMENKAEFELAQRFIVAAENLGFKAVHCLTSDEIYKSSPDIVLSFHHNFPKLTDHFTLGCMWNPPIFFGNSPELVRNVMSYDGYLFGSKRIEQYIDDLNWESGKSYYKGRIFPSCYSTNFRERDPTTASMAYVGTNWDGQRFKTLMEALASRNLTSFFGPRNSWEHVGHAYRGTIPFDGVSLLNQLWASGITLCLHKLEHLIWDVPNMRVFEALAASSIMVSDRNKFVEDNFGDTVWYLDRDLPPEFLTEQISSTIDKINSNPEKAAMMARASHEIFNERFSLERILSDLASEIGSSAYFPLGRGGIHERINVDCIVRTGLRDVSFLRRALDSLVVQECKGLRVIIVNNEGNPAVFEVIEEYKDTLRIKCIVVEKPINRSHSLWAGLKAVEADFFCILDDDDIVFRNHFATLLPKLESNPEAVLCYSGAIKHEEGATIDGFESEEQESRTLAYLHKFDLAALLEGRGFITSNSYLARSSALDEKLLNDPDLDAVEDFWLLIGLARKGKIIESWSVTSQFSWRRSAADNVSFQTHHFDDGIERIRTRLQFSAWPAAILGNHTPFFKDRENRYWHINNRLSSRNAVFVKTPPLSTHKAGHIDNVRVFEEYVEVSGWVPWRSVHKQQQILIYGAGEGQILISRIERRPDVAKFFDDWELYRSGFTVRFTVKSLVNGEKGVKFFASDESGTIFELIEARHVKGALSLLKLPKTTSGTNSKQGSAT